MSKTVRKASRTGGGKLMEIKKKKISLMEEETIHPSI